MNRNQHGIFSNCNPKELEPTSKATVSSDTVPFYLLLLLSTNHRKHTKHTTRHAMTRDSLYVVLHDVSVLISLGNPNVFC